MWEWPTNGPVPSHDEVRRREIEAGRLAPIVIGELNLDEQATDTGVPLGYTTAPDAGWVRLRWSELAERIALQLGAGQDVPPDHRWFPIKSWPANIQPPVEGSLDEASLHALLRVLAMHSEQTHETGCCAFYASLPVAEFDRPTLFRGPLGGVPTW